MSQRYEISIAFQTDKRAEDYVALARFVNAYDFDRVTVYCDAPFQPSFMPLLLMAQQLERAMVGVSAVPPSRIHPIDIAAQTALLAQVARGGVYMGMARGAWLEDIGIEEAKPAVQAMREAVEVYRYMLEGRTGGYQGQIYRLAESVRAPYPLPEKPVPLLIGTWGEKLAALAGEIADEVKIGGSANPDIVPVLQRYIAVGEQQAKRALGSVGLVVGAVSVLDDDREQARAEARRSVALYLPVVAPLDPTVQVEPELVARLKALVGRHDYAGAARLISDDLLEKFAFAGDADDFIRQADALFQAGARRVEFGTPHGLTPQVGIQRMGERVIPALRANWSR